jgi:hypothetical protein
LADDALWRRIAANAIIGLAMPASSDLGLLLQRGQIPPDAFIALLAAFGPLPAKRQKELAVRIINASQIYRLRKSVEKQFPLPHEQQKGLNGISASARGLLRLLGVNEAESVAKGVRRGSLRRTVAQILIPSLYCVALERRPATATAGADERLNSLVVLLSDLVEAAKRCALEARSQYRHGRGGERRAGKITAEVELLQAIFEAYACTRFPNSGPQPAFDQALRKFVRSGLQLVDSGLSESRITDEAIRAAFNRYGVHKPTRSQRLI